MKKRARRTPRDYDGIKPTGHQLRDVLPSVLGSMGRRFSQRGDLILASWPQIVGQRLAPMTRAVSFEEGLLIVHVKNATLLSLLQTGLK